MIITKTVPLLVTVDVEVASDHDLDEQAQILDQLRCSLNNLPITWFCTAVAAEQFSAPLRRLILAGHEIGCHGVDHSPEDDYRRMSPEGAEAALGEATHRIARVVGLRPRCFRGPRMTTSRYTQAALVTHGYHADFSVCAQRADFFISGGAELFWLFAPRGAYHPSKNSPFQRGELPLFVVNLSSLGVPFLSGVLYLGGLRLMQAFFLALLAEARRRRGAIVYLFHSYEFTSLTHLGRQPWHQRLYLSDRPRRYEMNLALLNYMSTYPGVQPMTASTFLKQQR
ncbi:MAG: polysaccharide deacetylase family protein [Prochloraceae cyanobacterium]|nr:polysaccharide deacetylase family protein [Prochloraceae cyanobacterium]